MSRKVSNKIFVHVDGIERKIIDLSKNNSTRLNLDKNSREIEIYKQRIEGKEFVEVFPVNFKVLQKEPHKRTFQLKNGEEIAFDFVPVKDSKGNASIVDCGITFDAKNAFAAKPAIATAAMASSATAANARPSSSTVTSKSNEGRYNKAILVPAAILLMLLLALGVGWLKYFGGNTEELAKDTTSEEQKNGNDVSKPVAKDDEKQEVDEPVTPDDISSGGDDDDDKFAEAESIDGEADNISSDSDSSLNDQSSTSNPTQANNVASIDSTSQSGASKSKTGYRDRIKLIKNRSTKRYLTSSAPIKRATQKAYPGGNRINADRLRVNTRNSTIELVRTPVKDKEFVMQGHTAKVDDKSFIPNKRVAKNENLNNVENIIEGKRDGGKTLLDIEKVYLEWDGDIDTGVKINQKVIESIQGYGLDIAKERQYADASLLIKIKNEEKGLLNKNPRVSADMWLTNDEGDILTPTATENNKKTLWKYNGNLEEMPDKIVADIDGLATAARKAEERKVNNLAKRDIDRTQKDIFAENNGNQAVKAKDHKQSNKNVLADNQQVDNDDDPNGKSLLEVEKVHLEWEGDIKTGVKINQKVVDTVQYNGGLNVMKDKQDADATLKINIEKESEGITADNPNVKADMWLINNKGKTLTPTTNGKTSWKYKGELKKMPNKIVEDIGNLKKVEKAKKVNTPVDSGGSNNL